MDWIFVWTAQKKLYLPSWKKTNAIPGCRLDGIEYHRPRLDDVFVAHTGRSLKDEPPAPAAA